MSRIRRKFNAEYALINQEYDERLHQFKKEQRYIKENKKRVALDVVKDVIAPPNTRLAKMFGFLSSGKKKSRGSLGSKIVDAIQDNASVMMSLFKRVVQKRRNPKKKGQKGVNPIDTNMGIDSSQPTKRQIRRDNIKQKTEAIVPIIISALLAAGQTALTRYLKR